MTVVVVGAYTVDLFMYGHRLPRPGETVDCPKYYESHGGKGANQAVAAARLGAPSCLITGLGADTIGYAALEMFNTEGLDTRFVAMKDDARTGVGFIIVDKDGIQLITTFAGASWLLTQEEILMARDVIHDSSVLLLQGEIPAEISSTAAALAGENSIVVLNPSPIETFAESLFPEHIDVLVLNKHEAMALMPTNQINTESLAKQARIKTILLTLGSEGAELYHAGETYQVRAPKVRAVDTTGAGDAFTGAFAAGLDRGIGMVDATKHACQCAAYSVTKQFCIPSFPTLQEIGWQ